MIRFLRFTPAYALVVFFNAYIFPFLGSGPHWKATAVRQAENCANGWWTNLLYLNNYISMEKFVNNCFYNFKNLIN